LEQETEENLGTEPDIYRKMETGTERGMPDIRKYKGL
jgi:hypothetical protein